MDISKLFSIGVATASDWFNQNKIVSAIKFVYNVLYHNYNVAHYNYVSNTDTDTLYTTTLSNMLALAYQELEYYQYAISLEHDEEEIAVLSFYENKVSDIIWAIDWLLGNRPNYQSYEEFCRQEAGALEALEHVDILFKDVIGD